MAISLNDNILTLAPKPTDFRYGPWNSTAQANAQIIIQERYLGLTVGIYSFIASSITEYWYHTGVTDSDLVIKSFSGTAVSNIEGGLNTYVLSTSGGSLTINVSGLTIDNLIVTGDTILSALTATTFYSGTTPLESIFPYSGTNIGSGTEGVFAKKNNDLLEFRTLSAKTKVSLTGTSDTIIISTSGINSYYIQELAPSGTTEVPLYDGDRWFNTLIGVEFVYIDDGNSTQWVEPLLSFTGNTIGGSGTTNYLTKFTSNVSVGDTVTPVVETGSGIVVGGTSSNPSAIFQIDSSSLGFLPPRMTEAQLNSIVNPAVGLIVYQTDGIEGLYVFKAQNNDWHLLG